MTLNRKHGSACRLAALEQRQKDVAAENQQLVSDAESLREALDAGRTALAAALRAATGDAASPAQVGTRLPALCDCSENDLCRHSCWSKQAASAKIMQRLKTEADPGVRSFGSERLRF